MPRLIKNCLAITFVILPLYFDWYILSEVLGGTNRRAQSRAISYVILKLSIMAVEKWVHWMRE